MKELAVLAGNNNHTEVWVKLDDDGDLVLEAKYLGADRIYLSPQQVKELKVVLEQVEV